jgi:hypothetical protein
MQYGWEGYGIYWGIIEKLRETANYSLNTNYSLIAFDLRTDASLIERIVNDFDLFVVLDTHFYSDSLLRRMQPKNDKSQQARMAANARWSKRKTELGQAQTAKNKPVEEKKEKKSFEPPTPEQVQAYCTLRNNGVDPLLFVNFYRAKGWMIGKNKMSNWQAAVRTWEQGIANKQSKHETPLLHADSRIHPALQR